MIAIGLIVLLADRGGCPRRSGDAGSGGVLILADWIWERELGPTSLLRLLLLPHFYLGDVHHHIHRRSSVACRGTDPHAADLRVGPHHQPRVRLSPRWASCRRHQRRRPPVTPILIT